MSPRPLPMPLLQPPRGPRLPASLPSVAPSRPKPGAGNCGSVLVGPSCPRTPSLTSRPKSTRGTVSATASFSASPPP
eukprot:5428874-Alexandrium_andersonii.AAC.1